MADSVTSPGTIRSPQSRQVRMRTGVNIVRIRSHTDGNGRRSCTKKGRRAALGFADISRIRYHGKTCLLLALASSAASQRRPVSSETATFLSIFPCVARVTSVTVCVCKTLPSWATHSGAHLVSGAVPGPVALSAMASLLDVKRTHVALIAQAKSRNSHYEARFRLCELLTKACIASANNFSILFWVGEALHTRAHSPCYYVVIDFHKVLMLGFSQT